MRIWNEKLIHNLCDRHLIAMWREGLGCLSIITQDKKGYRNHPAVKEFEQAIPTLLDVLFSVRIEMIARGFNPKPLPDASSEFMKVNNLKTWQTLEEQVEILKQKGCCNV